MDMKNDVEGAGRYVNVSVDGAPSLRKIDLKVYRSCTELQALENMFKLTIDILRRCFCVPWWQQTFKVHEATSQGSSLVMLAFPLKWLACLKSLVV
ncbi:hypothetical protein DITRI_Ditri19aG0024600 [Diplodiscus trichospermus]